MARVEYALVKESWPYTFVWKNTPEREKLFGRRCRIITQGTGMRALVVEFENGERAVVSERAIRRAN